MDTFSKFGSIQELTLGGRRVVAFIPAKITAETPILVAHDAQNYMIPKSETWNKQNWGVREAIEEGRILPDSKGNLPLIISMHLTDVSLRLNELAPQDFFAGRPELWNAMPSNMLPPSKELTNNSYTDAIANAAISEACAKFGITHALERTAISGSSMGGLASLYALGRHPQTFGWALAFSTHWPIGGFALVSSLIAAIPTDGRHKIWTDRGSLNLDATYEPFHAYAVEQLEAHGLKRDQDFQAMVFYGTDHNESYWAHRIEYPINWWLQSL